MRWLHCEILLTVQKVVLSKNFLKWKLCFSPPSSSLPPSSPSFLPSFLPSLHSFLRPVVKNPLFNCFQHVQPRCEFSKNRWDDMCTCVFPYFPSCVVLLHFLALWQLGETVLLIEPNEIHMKVTYAISMFRHIMASVPPLSSLFPSLAT